MKSFSSSPYFVFTILGCPISYIASFAYKDGIGNSVKASPKFFGARLAVALTSTKMREMVKQYFIHFSWQNIRRVHFVLEETIGYVNSGFNMLKNIVIG